MAEQGILNSPGSAAAQARLLDSGGSIRRAFDGLQLAFGYEDALVYLRPVRESLGLDEQRWARMCGHAMAFAAVCVEQDRAQRSAGEGDAPAREEATVDDHLTGRQWDGAFGSGRTAEEEEA